MRGIFPARSHFLAIRSLRAALVPLMLAGGLTGLEPGAAVAAACVSWSGVPPQSPGTVVNELAGTAVRSPCDAWAVGWDNSGSGDQTLIEHWDGASWTVLTSPDPGSTLNVLSGVQATSGTDAWAVGAYSNGSGSRVLILHWNGSTWTQVKSPSPGSTAGLGAISVVSAGNAWAVGGYAIIAARGTGEPASTGNKTLILHWNGTAWKQAASPTPGAGGALAGVAATSAGNAWAAGDFFDADGAEHSLILHWNGTAWKRQASPDLGTSSSLASISATSPGGAWAADSFSNATANQNLLLHWNGTKWSVVPSPDIGGPGNFNHLTGVAAASAGDARAVGGYATPGGENTLVLRWDGTRWAQVPSPTPGIADGELLGVAAGSASNFWAVGFFLSTATVEAFALHCC